MLKFYERRHIFFAISLALMLIGMISLFVNGVDLSIQFKGGAIISYSYDGTIDSEKVSQIATQSLSRNTTTQLTTDATGGNQKVVLSLAGNQGLSPDEHQSLEQALKNGFPDNNLTLSESNVVEPFIGRRFLTNGALAIAISALLIMIYVWVRFKKISGLSAGVMALIALLHDVLLVFFTFTVFKIPLDESFVAVTLTIIGYSINDTIIIYDRIRENQKLDRKMAYIPLVNKSITQTLARSIITVVMTLIAIITVFIFASIYNIESIKTFALPMIIGLSTGCYSSICLASPMWVMWQNHKLNERAKLKAKA